MSCNNRVTLALLISLMAPTALGQLIGGPYEVSPLDINGGGERSTSVDYTITASTGQTGGVGTITGAGYQLDGGFQNAALSPDCNSNGVDDSADIIGGTSADTNANGVPDECETLSRFVRASAAPGGDGLGWATAYAHLQDALAEASTIGFPTEVWVAAGTYQPDRSDANPTGTGDRTATFQLQDGVALYGGFAGTEDPATFNLADRDFVANETILSGDLAANDGPNFANNDENSYHVLFADSVGLSAVLDGFTITGGKADAPSGVDADGGGMHSRFSSSTLRNCIFNANQANAGGGIYNNGSSPTISACRFVNNASGLLTAGGGGMWNTSGSNPTLANCTFIDNTSTNMAGGIGNFNSSPTLNDCTLIDNSADVDGGGMFNQSSSPTVTDCTFIGNTTGGSGAAMNNFSASSPTITSCTFRDNIADLSGGGVFNSSNCDPAITGCKFLANSAGSLGGGMASSVGSPTVTDCMFIANTNTNGGGGASNSTGSSATYIRCTFLSNSSATNGGGMQSESGASPTLTDCIFIENSVTVGGGGVYSNGSTCTISGCTFVENASDGGGAVAAMNGSQIQITDTRFISTQSSHAVHVWPGDSTVDMNRCVFAGNEAPGNGGAAVFFDSGNGTISNSVIAGNSAVESVAGLRLRYNASATVTNCTFANNQAGVTAGGIWNQSALPAATLVVANSILWQNSDGGGSNTGESAQITGNAPDLAINFSNVQDDDPLSGNVIDGVNNNIVSDPLFVGGPSGTWTADATYVSTTGLTTLLDDNASFTPDELVGKFINPNANGVLQSLITSNGPNTIVVWGDFSAEGVTGATYQIHDYRLRTGSPAIDAADNTAPGLAGITTDLYGNPRFIDDLFTVDTGNGTPPIVDMGAYEYLPDCNTNGVLDELDIAGATSIDCNSNGVPDECELVSNDCNNNGVPDACDITATTSGDCNTNGVPDECELAGNDCNSNGVIDACDIADATSSDCNTNGVPDECDIIAATVYSEWGGGTGSWGTAPKWCPEGVPDNWAGQVFHVRVGAATSNVALDISPTVETLLVDTGAAVEVNNTDGSQTLTVVDTLTNAATLRANTGATLNLVATVVQTGAGTIAADGLGATVNIPTGSTVTDGVLLATTSGEIVLDGGEADTVSLEVTGGGNILVQNDGVLIDPTIQRLEVVNGSVGFVEGVVHNDGQILVDATSLPTALVPTGDSPQTKFAGSGELELFEDDAQQNSQAAVGDFFTPLVNSNGHTIFGTGVIEGFSIANAGTIRAVGVPDANLNLILFANTTINTGDIRVDSSGLLLSLGDVRTESPQGEVLVQGNAEVFVFGEFSLSEHGVYASTSGFSSATLMADSFAILGSSLGGSGVQMLLEGQMQAQSSGAAVVSGGGGCLRLRGCTPPILNVLDDAIFDVASLDLLEGGAMELGGNATADVGDLIIDTGGTVRGTAGSAATLIADSALIVNTNETAGQMILSDSMGATVSGDVIFSNTGGCRRSERGCTPPILNVLGQATLIILGDLDINGVLESTVDSSEAVTLGGSFANESTDPVWFDWVDGGLILDGVGLQTFEAAGVDVGADTNGMVNNFAIGQLEVAAGATIRFENAFANQVSANPCAEAVYVRTLVFRGGSSIELDNCSVYCMHVVDEGALVATIGCGKLTIIPTGDMDGDGDVDLADYAAIEQCLAGPGTAYTDPACAAGDYDADGDVDLADVAEFLASFTSS